MFIGTSGNLGRSVAISLSVIEWAFRLATGCLAAVIGGCTFPGSTGFACEFHSNRLAKAEAAAASLYDLRRNLWNQLELQYGLRRCCNSRPHPHGNYADAPIGVSSKIGHSSVDSQSYVAFVIEVVGTHA